MTARDSRRRALHVAAAIFAMTTGFFLAKTGRDALFFQGRGLLDLPAGGPAAPGNTARRLRVRRMGS